MRILVLDLGLNNINSVMNSLKDATTEADSIEVVFEYTQINEPVLLVLPGLGKFDAALKAMKERNFFQIIEENRKQNGYLVGICLGMQLLFSSSEESPGNAGLDLISGEVRKLSIERGEKIPNVGWGTTKLVKDNDSFPSLSSESDYYFVHSYAAHPRYNEDVLCTTGYGNNQFVSGVLKENTLGVQFHPEKSSKAGAALIKDIISWSKSEI